MSPRDQNVTSGRTVEATGETELFALGGPVGVNALRIDSRVAPLRRVPSPLTTQPMVGDEIILLAHMIGDGSCLKRQPIRYASIDEMDLRAVTDASKHFVVTARRDDQAVGGLSSGAASRRNSCIDPTAGWVTRKAADSAI